MVVELHPNEYEAAKKLYASNLFRIPALAVLNRRFPGRVFADNRDNPNIVIVWALSRWAYISCGGIEEEHKSFVAEAFDSYIIPLLKDMGEHYFEIYADNDMRWDGMFGEALGEYKLSRHYENTYTLSTEKFARLDLCLEHSEDIEITENMFPIVPENYYKYSAFDIPDKNLYGMSIMKNGKTISQCLCNGFISDNRYFIDLDTFMGEERNKGYGTLIAYKLINNLLGKGLMPLWETTAQNIPSQKVADKLGFEKAEEYPVYAISNF